MCNTSTLHKMPKLFLQTSAAIVGLMQKRKGATDGHYKLILFFA